MKTLSLFLLTLLSQTTFAAGYSVPVPDDLADHAHYSNTVANGAIKDGVLTVYYELPATLVGKSAPGLTFTGKATGAFITVSGKFVNGVCMRSKVKPMTCVLRYPGLEINAASRDEAIRETFSGELQVARLEVGRLFGNDPAGILSLELMP